jgi:hypothetical protein
MKNMKIEKVLSTFILATCGMFPLISSVKAEQIVTDISGGIQKYELSASIVEAISSKLGNNVDKKYIFKTPEGLFIDNYLSKDNGDGTVNVKMTVYNKYNLDGLVEIRDSRGKITRYAESEIKAFKYSENLIEGAVDMVSNADRGFAIPRLGFDPTDSVRSSKTDVEFTLKKVRLQI